MSIFRSKAGILQAFHDGKHLHISKSKFYDFKENIRENCEFFARWTYRIPCDDTITTLPIDGKKLNARTCQLS
ncbi:hypothetical protein I7I53_11498 [Histoplasma capsulatum var. duboisii H88]|nr:hypothetical protein I7I53_11498 [Histoplasma capsulatum var. duboisii H88]